MGLLALSIHRRQRGIRNVVGSIRHDTRFENKRVPFLGSNFGNGDLCPVKAFRSTLFVKLQDFVLELGEPPIRGLRHQLRPSRVLVNHRSLFGSELRLGTEFLALPTRRDHLRLDALQFGLVRGGLIRLQGKLTEPIRLLDGEHSVIVDKLQNLLANLLHIGLEISTLLAVGTLRDHLGDIGGGKFHTGRLEP